ncbi:MAG: ArsR/SmtB family transcription factor [Streptosporangiaceae bacterium]
MSADARRVVLEVCRDPVQVPAASTPEVDDETLDDETLAAMTKALGHPTRVRILRLLAERRSCVTGDLVAEFPLAQSTISEHLRILREAGLVQGEIEGPRTSYCVNRTAIASLQRAISCL